MKVCYPAAAAMLALGLSSTAFAASGSVVYQCQGNQKVSVNYVFNSAGVPTTATATLKGKRRTLRHNLARSNNVDTFFTDKRGYEISAAEMNADNYRQAPIMALAPNGEILLKNCSPVSRKAEMSEENKPVSATKVTKTGSVSYMCQNKRRVKVDYAFNAAGVPVKAEANVNGKRRTLKYNLARSNNVDAFFTDANGYELSTSAISATDFRDAPVMVLAPDGEIVYKDCSPTR